MIASPHIDYGPEIEAEISHLVQTIQQVPTLKESYRPRWLAIQLLEGDTQLLAELEATQEGKQIRHSLHHSLNRLEQLYGEDIDIMLADSRYSFVNQLVHSVLIRSNDQILTPSDKIDRIMTHRIWGIPIFLALMWVVFKLTADVSAPYLDWIDGIISGPITNWTISILSLVGLSETWIESLLVEGIIAGVGGVLVFVPVLMTLYLALAVLEDSGYMARAALVMDRLMQPLGLHGKSFLPLMVGFGCTVPALYATRTLDNHKDRILTGLLTPFMSCGARLPVYVLFATIFFPAYAGWVIFGLYLTGIIIAIIVGLALKNTLFKTKEYAPFVMELPAYRIPNWQTIWLQMWQRITAFIRSVWTLILVTSIVIWFLMATPLKGEGTFAQTELNNSAFAVTSQWVTPLFEPVGFGNWETVSSLISGFVAKEVIISTMSQVHTPALIEESSESTPFIEDIRFVGVSFFEATVDTIKAIPLIVGIDLREEAEDAESIQLHQAVQSSFEASSGEHASLAALAFLVFVLLYTPCMAAVATERQELGVKWMWFSVIGQTILAWFGAWIVFQGGLLLGLG